MSVLTKFSVKDRLISASLNRPKQMFMIVGLMMLAALAAIPNITIDTDPENMLPADNHARVLHDELKHRFGLSDMVVVGLVNAKHEEGIYNPQSLSLLHTLSEASAQIEGVVVDDLMSLEQADNISQGEGGQISFSWMMPDAPKTQEQAMQIKAAVKRLPMLENTLVSGDGKAAGLYIPIESKDISYRVYQDVLKIAETLELGDNQLYVTGLPVAEDTFGVEMFKQMAVSAPAAGLLIFLLMLYFFRSMALVIAPMIVAMATVIITMGLMIAMGYPVHIMTSMIPIFLMPIAVVDSVHMLSEFSDRYRIGMDKKELAQSVVSNLFQPMLFTSLTSMVGFLSLNTADIPPVKVFGTFVGIGIALAFLFSIVLIPAYIALLSDEKLEQMSKRVQSDGMLSNLLKKIPKVAVNHSVAIIAVVMVILSVSAVGISKIVINDNPINWFEKTHPIRQADKVLNEHFAGTYEAYLSFDLNNKDLLNKLEEDLDQLANEKLKGATVETIERWESILNTAKAEGELDLQVLKDELLTWQFDADGELSDQLESLSDVIDERSSDAKVFLNPKALAYLEEVQQVLENSPFVGKTSALPDLLKTVNRELKSGLQKDYVLPLSEEANAQAILSYQSSHKPDDIWHMVTPDYQHAVIWVQLSNGDNRDMNTVLEMMDAWFLENPAPNFSSTLGEGAGQDTPVLISHHWGGLTYINVVWQKIMVNGMLGSLLSSFFIVALMMSLLFRSLWWGLIAMLPLTLTIAFIYGLIGFFGKDYDMPIAVLSALTLGMSIDFAIHFIERTKFMVEEKGDWLEAIVEMFEEPGRAISRNAIVIAFGFTPLLLAPLVPYQTVGFFLATIMVIGCLSTLFVLPALIHLARKHLFDGRVKNL